MEDYAHRYPLKLAFVPKTALWGGETLKENYGKACDCTPLAETWELSVREAENSMIENGPAAGMLLGQYFEDYGRALLGTRAVGDRFPLLIKFIDAAAPLSVQVHPADAYATAHEGDLGKTEMWVVLEAAPDATLICGLKPGLTADDLAAAVRSGDTERALERVSVKAGDVVFIPAGMPHAIGGGILLAEIQQSSDVTYRLYDYGRLDKDGRPRPLHVEKALAVSRPYRADEVEAIRFSRFLPSDEEEMETLAACDYFCVRRCELDGKQLLEVTEESFLHILCTDGEGEIVYERESYPFEKGDSYFLPAGLGEIKLRGEATLLLTTL